MSESMDEDIRVYSFPHAGYIAGVPGIWPAGSKVTIRESTREVVDVWPKPVEPPALEIETEEQTDTIPPAQQPG